MRAELIAVGTELLLGSIANTDGAYLSRRLAEMGIDVLFHSVVGDNKQRLQNAVRLALSRSDIVILSGGLGPTTDDITKEAVAELVSLSLEEHLYTKRKIVDYYTKVGREITELSLKQALIPHGSIVFDNDCGTAPGICIEGEKQAIIILPGPPRELEDMFEKSVAPYLKKYCDAIILSSSAYLVGKGEPWVEARVGDLIKSENPTFALYAKEGEVQIRVTAKASNRADAVKIVKGGTDKLLEIFGDDIYGIDPKNIETTVVDALCEREKTVTTAESLTGGLISQKITSVSGASNVFKEGFSVYSNKAKHELLGVRKKTLKKHTAVSEQVAAQMAIGARKKAKSDYAIATTGVAGPGADSDGNPQGLVFVAVADKKRVWVKKLTLGHGSDERQFIREVTSKNALDMLRRMVTDCEIPDAVSHKTALDKFYTLDSRDIPKTGFFPKKGDGSSVAFKKIARIMLIVLLAALLMIGGVFVAQKYSRIWDSNRLFEVFSKAVYNPSSPVDENGFDTRLSTLRAQNPDTVAWISVKNTDLRYAVMFGEKYQSIGFDGKNGSAPYVSEDTDFRAPMQNIVVNSTRELSKNAFYDLRKYSDVNFYKSHPIIDMVSVAGESQWKVFAAFVASCDESRDGTFEYYNYPNFLNADEMFFYVDEVRSRSLINTKIDIRNGDTLMTLSVPSTEFDGAQFVVVARKVRRAELNRDDYKSATATLVPLYPDEWYEKNGSQKPDFSELIGADDVIIPDEDYIETTPVPENPNDASSVEETSSEETSSNETSHESSSEQASSEEISSEVSSEISSSQPVSSEVSSEVPSSRPTSSETPSSRPVSSETPSSRPVSSETPSSKPVSSEVTSSEITSSETPTPPPVTSTGTLKVRVNGRVKTGDAYDIVCQIVANEIGNSSPKEALKAQAVAALTYVEFYNSIGQTPDVAFKTPSTAVKNAVAEVINERVYYNGKIALTCYGAMSAGKTNSSREVWGGHYPYLVSVDSPHDKTASGYRVEKQYNVQTVKDLVKKKLGISLDGDPSKWFEVKSLTSGGYNNIVAVGGQTKANGKDITGRLLRESVLSLRSAAFDIEYDADSETFTFTTYGYGHGVGMSQWGAIYYAQRDGWDYKQILTHYFPGTQVG